MTRILLDQNVPRSLARHLAPHHVERAFRRGWAGLVNGDLIAAAEAAGFEVLITGDQNLAYQQNLSSRSLAIIVINTNRWPSIAKKVRMIAAAVDQATPGSFQTVRVYSR